jgi:hypothetical protein
LFTIFISCIFPILKIYWKRMNSLWFREFRITLSDIIKCILIDHSFDYFQRDSRGFWSRKFRHIITLWNQMEIVKRWVSIITPCSVTTNFFFLSSSFFVKIFFCSFSFAFCWKKSKIKFIDHFEFYFTCWSKSSL